MTLPKGTQGNRTMFMTCIEEFTTLLQGVYVMMNEWL